MWTLQHQVYLQENHRASRKLVEASNRLISRNKLRVSDKHIYSKNEEGEFPLLIGTYYRDAFHEEGIPSIVTSDRSFFRRPEIRGICSILELLNNMEKDPARTRVMMEFFQLSGLDKGEAVKFIGAWRKILSAEKPAEKSLLALYYRILSEFG